MTYWILGVLLLWAFQCYLPALIRYTQEPSKAREYLMIGLGTRDEEPPMPLLGQRAERARRNMLEALPLFLGVSLLLEVHGTASPWSHRGAGTFLLARVLYVPAYMSGITGLRSSIHTVGWVGLAMMIFSLLGAL